MDLEKVSAAAEEFAAQRQAEQERAEAEANKSVWDRLSDMGNTAMETLAESYKNKAKLDQATNESLQDFGNTLAATGSDIITSIQQANENRLNFLHESANLQEKAMNGQVTEEDIDTLRQSGRDASVSLANVAASPFRQVAREFIQGNATDNDSPFQELAQNLQQSDVNIEYFMTPEEKLQKSYEIEKELGLPAESTLADNEAYKAALEMYNLKKKNDAIEDVWEEYPELRDIANMGKTEAAMALHDIETIRKTHGIIDSFTHFLERGNIKLEYDNLQYKIMQGQADSNDIQRAEDLKRMMDADKKKAPSFWDDPAAAMAAGVAQSLPEMTQGIKEGAEDALPSMAAAALFTAATGGTGGLALAAAAGTAGLRAAIMRALASQGVKTVGKRVFQAGMFKGMAEAEIGSRYGEMGERKGTDGKPLYTDDERRLWAMLGGIANAGIEMLDFGLITNALKPTPHAARVFEDIISNAAMKKTQREKIAEMVGGRAKDWLKLTAAESGEEALQSASDDIIHNLSVESTGERGKNIKQYSAKDIMGRSAAAFIESLPGSMGFATIGAGGGMVSRAGALARNARREARLVQQYGENAAQTMNGTIMVEQLQQAVASGKLKETAPDVQKKILRDQLAGTGYEMAHIDVETALQKENGVEDLKKVAKAAGMTNEELDTAISQQAYINVPVEVLAQSESSPELLDSVTFNENAESMAHMRMNQKELAEAYNEAIKRTLDNRQQLIQNIISQVLPDNATKEQKEMLETAIMMNPDNPAQGYAELRKAAQGELNDILNPALNALRAGMGNAGLMDIEDEQGNTKTIRYTENADWYRNFYKQFKRQPTKAELQDMAIALLTGDAAAPQVQGWTIDSEEAQQGMEQNKANINRIRGNLKALQEIKDSAEKLTGVEMQLTEGLTPEGFKMYRQLADWLRNVGGATARQARMGAILAARHADIYAAKVTERTGKKYTAEDYMRDKIGFSVRRADTGLNQLAGVNAINAPMKALDRAKEMEAAAAYPDDIFNETGWIKGQDGKWRFEIPDNLDNVNWDVFKKGNTENKSRLLKYIYKNPKLYEAYPWLANIIVEVRPMEGNTYGGVAKNDYIVIKEEAGDEQKSGTLIHEIQHLIQDREGFAVGGTDETAHEQIIDRIRELTKKIQSYDYGAEYADAIMDQQEMFLESLENPEAVEILNQEINELEKKIPAKERDEIWQLASDRQYLRETIDENAGEDYSLYKNLAGEQEARHATDRAIIHTNVVRAEKELAEKKAKYEAEKAKQSPAMKKMLDELEALREKNDKTDAEYARIDEIKAAMDDKLMQADTFYTWAKNTLGMRKREAAETPQPHNENAIVVFGGQEMAMSQEPRTLAAYHNTRVDNLEKLLEQGLAVPSIAITHKDIPYDNFGDVTLVGNKNLIDPESGVPVWTRDAYTTRIPRAEYLPTEKKKIKAFMDKWRKNLQGIADWEYVLDRLEEAAQEDPELVETRTHRDEFTYYYLTKILGRDVEVKQIRPDYEVPILRNGIYAEQIESIMHSKKKKADKKKALTEVFIARYEKALAEYAESIPKKKAYLDAQPSPKRKMMYEKALERQRETQDNLAALKQTGEINEEQYKEIQKDISRVDKAEKESTEIDWGKTFSEMRANNKDALNSDKYQQWQDKLLDAIRGDAVIKIGRKYEPYTTDNIVRAMLKESGAAQENVGGFSTSKAAAMGAKSLKSIADLHKNESRLVTHEQANKVIADVDTAINESFEGVREYHKNIAADSYSLPEIYNEAVANAIKGGKKATTTNVKAALKKMDFDVAKIPASAIDKAVDAANKMREAAAWYFEAKPQRAVGINEFSGAVVPIDTPAETIQKLIDNGLTVETYNPEVAGDRQRATKAVQEKRAETLFQRAWVGSPADFNKFDLGYVGTGEGAAAHGYGLYSAADRKVAEGYRKRLAGTIKMPTFEEITVAGVSLQDMLESAIDNGDYEKQAMLENYETYNRQGVLQSAKEEGFEQEYIDWFNKIADKVEKQLPEQPGKLYEVEIPDNDVLLDEQKPLSQQPEKVKEAIINILAEKTTNEEIEELEYVQKEIIASKDLDKTAAELIENPFYEYSIISEESEKIFDLLREGKRSQGLLLTKQLIAELTNGKNKVLDRVEKKYSNTIGKKLYDRIAYNPREASEKLNAAGVKGITYNGGMDGRCFVIFDDKAIDIIEKYNQQVAQQQIKGQTSLQVNGKRIVSILESADESTFMHEMAHVFLYDLQDLAQIDDVSAKELEIVNEWTNWQKGAAAEYKSTPWAREFAQLEQEIIDAEAHGDLDTAEQKKRQWRQERFARGFELYLKDGQAPAKGLKAVFRKFKQFLRQIYAAFVSDGGKPTLPVKRVMDRMIASEQEIEAMELEDRYADVKKAGGAKLFEESEEDTYNRWYEEASAEAKEKLLKIVMKDLEKEKQAQFDLQIEEERNRKRNELQQEPVYLAERAVMASGNESIVTNWFPSVEAFKDELAKTPSLEDVLQEHMDKFSEDLDARLIDEHLSPEAVDKAMKTSKYRTKMESLKTKAMAKKLGLLNRINSKAEKAMESIEEKLTALPEETDLTVDADSDGVKSVMQEINKLRYSAKWNAAELGHIESMIRASTQEEVRAALKELKDNKSQDKQREEEILKANEGRQAIFRDMARESMTAKPISESCNVNYYVQQEKKMARRVRDMIRAKRWDMAMRAQEQQGIYAAMAEMAEQNREQRNKLLSQVNRELNTRTVRVAKNERYWHRHLAYILRIAKTDATPPAEGFVQLNDLLQNMSDSLDILEHSLDNVLIMANQGEDFKGYQDLTMDQFRDAVESIHVLYVVGRDKFKMKTISGKSIFDVIDEIKNEENTVAQNAEVDTRKVNPDKGGVAYSEMIGNTGDIGHLIAKRGQDYIISSVKPENILKMLGNAAHRYIYGTLELAAENEAKMQAANIEALRDIMSVYTHKERQDFTKKIYDLSTEKGDKISKEQIMCMALNWGTLSNRQRLVGGLASDERTPEAVAKMTEEVMRLFQETMTERDWMVIQKLWDHIGTYWEDTVKVEEKLNGISLQKIPATPFTMLTADGKEIKLAGGYMPVKYAPEKSSRAEEHEVNEMAQSLMAGAQRFGAGRSFTKGRTEFDIFRPLQLEFGVIEDHLQNVIHNATYRLPVRDVYRLITNTEFEEFVVNHIGREYHKVLRDWAVDTWKQVNPNTNTADNVLSQGLGMLRRSATMSIMGYRIWPVIENVSNISVAAGKIGSGEMAAAIGDFYSDLRGNFDMVKKKSIFMRNRLDNMDRDIRSQAGIFHADNKLFEVARDHAYDLMVYSDLMVSAPLWLRSYKNAFEPAVDKVKKENEKNIGYLIKCQQEVDRIQAEIAALRGEAKAMDEHLKDRRYASPETAEALRQSPFAMHTDNDLRALSGENMKRAKAMEKDLWAAEVAFQEAQEIKILSDDEILEEAEQRAVFEADGIIRDTFGSGRTLDLPAVQRSRNEITKLLTTFYGFFNTQFNAVYMSYVNSKYLPAESAITKWAPFAKQVMFRFVFTALIGSLLQYGFGLAGNDDDDKKRKVKDANGKEVEVEVPSYERFLKVFGKNTISTATGSMYLVRDVINAAMDFVINDKAYGMNTGSVAGRGASEFGKMFMLLSKKGQRDAEIQAKEEKRQKTHEEKLAKYKGKKRQEYLKKWEEEQKYQKPPKRITYTEIAGHGLKGLSSMTAANTGITSTMVNSVTSTMQYLLDTDMRYDPTWKNIIWSAIFDKKPVEREIPKKPPKEETKTNKKKRKQSER